MNANENGNKNKNKNIVWQGRTNTAYAHKLQSIDKNCHLHVTVVSLHIIAGHMYLEATPTELLKTDLAAKT